MKILLVSLFLPHPRAPHAGGRYVYEVLRYLAERHEVTLVTRVEEAELPLVEELRPLCRDLAVYPYRTVAKRSFVHKLGLIVNYLGFSLHADRLIRSGDYDLVQVEWVETALLIGRHGTPMVLDAHDVITKPAERQFVRATGPARAFARLRYLLTRAVERRIMRRFSRVITLSDFDRQYLQRLVPDLAISTVPIPAGMDLTARTFHREPATLLFLASYKYRPVNVTAALWFCREVLPLVRARVPAVRFVIAGYGPPPELTRLAETDEGVIVTGFVDDPEEYYKEATVFVAPILTGGGIIVKILDALAAGTPVVTTSYGNEGVGATPGRDLLVADHPDDFAAAVVCLLQDRETAGRLSANGQVYVQENYARETVLARLERILAETLAAGGSDGM